LGDKYNHHFLIFVVIEYHQGSLVFPNKSFMSHNNGVATKHVSEFVFLFKKCPPSNDEGNVGGLNGTPHFMNIITH
jgi:hypothetical protein